MPADVAMSFRHDGASTGWRARPATAAGALRLLLFVLVAVLTAASKHRADAWPWLVLIAPLGLLATLATRRTLGWPVAVALELGAAAAAVPLSGGSASPIQPYVLAPIFAVGFQTGVRPVLVAGGALAAGLVSGVAVSDEANATYVATAAEWSVLALALGLIAAWARSLLDLDATGTRERYEQAYRLLSELRGVARRLPGSLDPVAAGEAMLDACTDVAPAAHAALLLPTSADRLAPLVIRGADRLDVDLRTSGSGPVAVAWQNALVVREGQRSGRSGMGALLAVPVVSDGTCTALLVLEDTSPTAYTPKEIAAVTEVVRAAHPRVESALLFDEIRSLATVEERQRLAREIHDGIAQELVYVGYELDNLVADIGPRDPAVNEAVRRVRQQLTRIISELRLSIFTLRSTVERAGLGAALSEFANRVSSTGLTIHLSLSEQGDRLPHDTETELLRIAQEAISDARRRPGVRNLWVSLRVDPPGACLRVEDDGEVVPARRAADRDRVAREIIAERAARLSARHTVSLREGGGTIVEVELGA